MCKVTGDVVTNGSIGFLTLSNKYEFSKGDDKNVEISIPLLKNVFV